MKYKYALEKNIRLTWVYLFLIIGVIVVLMPFVVMILTAVKLSNEVLSMPPKIIPSQWQWDNFRKAYDMVPFQKYLFNSVFVAFSVTITELFTTILAAYSFSFIPFKGKKIAFVTIISTMIVPDEIFMIANFITLSRLGWINTYEALIFPWCTSVFSIFLLKQHFDNIPISYYKAAKVDGCSQWRFLTCILLPMSRPIIISVALLKFIGCWNSYLWPLLATNTKDMRTLPVGLAAFSTEAGTRYNLLMAFSVLMIAPIVVLYLSMQKQIIKGVSNAGIKA